MILRKAQRSHSIDTHTEFFAGVGGVSLGLDSFETIWANDIDPLKCEINKLNHPNTHVLCEDISKIKPSDFPNSTIASATFPCTNTSCAGGRQGLLGIKSGVVYRWLNLLKEKRGTKSHPLSMLENPTGLIARNQGADLRSLVLELNSLGYAVNISVVDAKHFVPQSRPRIFITGVDKKFLSPKAYRLTADNIPSDKELVTNPLRRWMLSNLDLDMFALEKTQALPTRTLQLEDVINFHDDGYWAEQSFSDELVANLTGAQLARFKQLVNSPVTSVSTVARRGRKNSAGIGYNATEISVSGLAPAQRPYKGGSSRCWVLIAGKGDYRFKCVSPRESARLMGFDDTFELPGNDKAAYGCTGDAVCPQAVNWVEQHIIREAYAKEEVPQLALAI